MFQHAPTFAQVWKAQERIRPFVMRTPLRRSGALSQRLHNEIFLKLENWQPTGSFKVRGAFNLLGELAEPEIARGLVAASAGNHGSAVGYAAQQLGISNTTIFVPGTTPRAKVDKMKRYGVDVREVGVTYDDAHHAAVEHERMHDATFVHAYDDARTVAGAGTVALEMLEQAQALDAVVVPVGGGGLISGIAVVLKELAPQIRLVAVQPEASPALRDSLRDGVCYQEYTAGETICDGLAGGIGQIVYEVAHQKLIDESVIVSEAAVRRAVADFAGDEQMIVEGSGAVGLAAVNEYPRLFINQRVGLVVSGGNIDKTRLAEILREN